MTTHEGILLIGEFMGLPGNHCRYNERWDYLIPVCKKIKALKVTGMESLMDVMKATQEMNNGLVSLDLDKTYKGVIQFIEWYNKTSKAHE